MAGGWILDQWNKWGIQIMVVASFALQVFLLVCGGTRRRSSSAVVRIALWLAYLSADSTAIYTLGHLSVASRSRKHQLVAFWAPFLLLHLGGPDNITAYALEDNRLWLRHLQTLTVQALGAAFVVYKYIASDRNGTLLLLATISMFVAGLVKYGERIWALKCGSISSIGNSFDGSDDRVNCFEQLRQLPSDEEEILLGAHSHFDICKGAFTDATSSVNSESTSRGDACPKQAYLNLYKLVEMELSLMYDILYTKAAVIHTWYGFCIHFISLLGTAISFVLFQLSIGRRGGGYSRVDMIISYVLLAGAFVLEAMSLCRALLSSWTCSFLHGKGRGWKWLLDVITPLRRCVKVARRRLWPGSIGQYNLLHMCASDRNGILFWLAKKLGLKHQWNKLRFSGKFSGSEFCSVEDLKILVWQAVAKVGTGMNSRGSATLQRYSCEKVYNWSVEMDLDKSILVWHIVTDLIIRVPGDGEVNKMLADATKVLSNYMMFLLVVKPDMLPGRTRRNVYLNASKELDSCWSCCLKVWSPDFEVESQPRADMLADWLLADLYHTLRKDPDHPSVIIEKSDIEGLKEEKSERAKDVYNAIWIYRSLHSKVTSLEMIFELWVEIMVYVAEHCSRDSHARHLSQGGEFVTIVWLMINHLKDYSVPQDTIPLVHTSAPTLPEDSTFY
ncbi:hypothetical protein ACP70R_012150 [Stipagrostis hirtigluma subsp. patula]